LQWPVLTIAGILQTIPGLALLALMVPIVGMIGIVPALIALTIYSILPILRNTVTGIVGVDPAVREAAIGIGMTDWQLLQRVELPLALPVIVAGIRTAAVWVVGTATLATPVGAVSLGNYIFSGLQTQNFTAVSVGCIAAALLAIVIDQLVRLVERAVTSRRIWFKLLVGALVVAAVVAGLSPKYLAAGNESRQRTVIIGAKTFTEQYILAELLVDRLQAAGFSTDVRSGMGSIILFEALSQGDIDLYVDYSGTIWTNAMKRTEVPSRQQVLSEMTEWLKRERNVHSLGSLGFENAYALAVRKQMADSLGLKTIEDLVQYSHELSIGSDYEFFARPEWEKLQSTYNLNFAGKLTLDPTLMYSAVAQDDCDIITAFSTDGRIIAYDLVLLEDTRQAFPPYDAVLLLSQEAAASSKLVRTLKPIIGSISNQQMRLANKLVDLDGISLDSAAGYLRDAIEN
jgi:osmoprotectant transport system permease protein